MKRKNRFMATALACALTLSMAVPAFAADGDGDGYDDTTGNYIGGQTVTGTPDTDLKGGTAETYHTDGGRAVPFIGVIQPTQIKATIPTQVVFDLDPTIDLDNVASQWYGQVTNPSNLKVVNNSTVPMYVYVSEVTTMVDNGTAVTLVNKPDALKTTARQVMFGLTSTPEAGGQTLTGTADHWMVPTDGTTNPSVLITDSKHYVLNPLKTGADIPGDATKVSKYEAVAPDDGTAGSGPDELQLWVNCASYKGWSSDDVFTVMPTIIVAAKDPDVTPEYTASTVTDPGKVPVTPKLNAPTVNVTAGEVAVGTKVKLFAEPGATIYYTTDGTTAPTTASTKYTTGAEISIDAATTIKAIAVQSGRTDSEVATFAYTVPATPSP